MTYRVLITGSRAWGNGDLIRDVLSTLLRELYPDGRPGEGQQPVLVHGDARGADRIARDIWRGWGLPHEPHPVSGAQWRERGKRAGMERNIAMTDSGVDLCLAFVKDGSRGATQCAEYAESVGVHVRRWTA